MTASSDRLTVVPVMRCCLIRTLHTFYPWAGR